MIHLSTAALNEILRLRAKLDNPKLLLRIKVESGGCLGKTYGIGFDSSVQPSDKVYTYDRLQVVADPHSLSYLNGLMLDYSEDLMGGGFRFQNPNALQSCSCGSSFV
jgi:iron-sulfur cluster assembly protein